MKNKIITWTTLKLLIILVSVQPNLFSHWAFDFVFSMLFVIQFLD